jgi:PelA/Pel-15E family pectate lyase
MNHILIRFVFIAFALTVHLFFLPGRATAQKLRVVVLTDIENEPDDAMSMVRLLTYANQWEVEGLIATTSVHQRDKTAAWRIRQIVAAYGKVRDNLETHEPGYPTADHLLAVIREGRPAYGMAAVGPGMDSPGSDLIIQVVDRNDPRPVWVPVWGGPNCLAQALWKIRATRSPAALDRFVAKLRVYTISDQDDSGPWLRKTFPNLFYIASPGLHAGGAYHYATWSGISGDNFHGRFSGADFTIVDNPWLDRNIRSKGPLGAEHPRTTFLMEGDTPSFLYLVTNGLGDPEHPDWGSWGGRYEFYTPRTRKWFYEPETRAFWSDAEDEVLGVDGKWHTSNKATIWRWRSAYQNDFAARMDWTIKPYADVNHPPAARLRHANQLTAKSGERVTLSAAGSSDPDGDALAYEWFYYGEPGTLPLQSGRTGAPLGIENATSVEAWFTAPAVTQAETMHIVLAVTDQGTPPLTRYQRVLVTVQPAVAAGRAPQVAWGPAVLQQPQEWYSSPRARAIADAVLLYQSPVGAWPKNTDLSRARPAAMSAAEAAADPNGNTIDNDGTTLPMEFLARVAVATGDTRYRTAFERGVDYLLAAQYHNGGWPQFFPLREGYYSRITYNDNAMIRVLTVLRDIAAGVPHYAFVDAGRRTKAGAAVARGLDVILRTQLKQGGALTAWCAQYDERTLEPAWARNYEPPTLSGSESVGIIRFLVAIDRPTPKIVAAVEGAVAWLKSVAIAGLRYEEVTLADGTRDRRVVADPSAPPLWARFYDLGTNRPVFTGRDRVIRAALSEIDQERRSGYAYYGTWPASLLATDYPRWRARVKR